MSWNITIINPLCRRELVIMSTNLYEMRMPICLMKPLSCVFTTNLDRHRQI